MFDSRGVLIEAIARRGSGPGEIGFIDVFDIASDGTIYVYDGDNRRISIYSPDYEFVDSYPVSNVGRLRNMALGLHEEVYFLPEQRSRSKGDHAVRAYDSKGNPLGNWGHSPYSAIVQENLVGGGIDVDNEGNIYYGFISDHRIWKMTSDGTVLTVFDDQPSYYRGPDEDELRKFDGTPTGSFDRMRYFMRRSQVARLFVVPEMELLFQMFVTRVPGQRQVKLSLELWSTDGFKIASDIRSPGVLLFADKDFLYYVTDQGTQESNPEVVMYSYLLVREEVTHL